MIINKDIFFNVDINIQFTNNELINMAKRDNNTKRPFLFVNSIQGKHIPVSPTKSINLFSMLAEKLYNKYSNEKLLLIGFAETATAIGSAIACMSPIDTYYIHTTRENIINAEYLFFTESHSHATEQRLVKNNLYNMIRDTDRIVFVEDEVTTGNTIMKIVKIISEEYKLLNPKFAICSILNSMNEENINKALQLGIICTYYLKINLENYSNIQEKYNYKDSLKYKISADDNISEIVIGGKCESRAGVTISCLRNASVNLAKSIIDIININDLDNKDVLVLGCEEFMFPPMYVAYYIEQNYNCKSVRFHATTRSPILPSDDNSYPLKSRYEVGSAYEDNRVNFIYNLKSYDKVILIHDSHNTNISGIGTIIQSLKFVGCDNISIFKWVNGEV